MNPYRRLMRRLGRARLLAWLGPRVLTPFDQLSHGKRIPDTTLGLGLPLVYLTTKGRRTGLDRTVPLLGIPHDDGGTVVPGTNWGSPHHPAWVHNLRSEARATLELDGASIDVIATPIEGSEYEQYWQRFTAIWPGYDDYRRRAHRTIALYVLEEQ